jgi:hypothetical protein
MMKEKHGILARRAEGDLQNEDVVRRNLRAACNSLTPVNVQDGDNEVFLSIVMHTTYAAMTPAEARFIAAALIASADRVENVAVAAQTT